MHDLRFVFFGLLVVRATSGNFANHVCCRSAFKLERRWSKFDSPHLPCRIDAAVSSIKAASAAPQKAITCRSGGIGRRAWFRSMYPQGCGGSSPFFGTSASESTREHRDTLESYRFPGVSSDFLYFSETSNCDFRMSAGGMPISSGGIAMHFVAMGFSSRIACLISLRRGKV